MLLAQPHMRGRPVLGTDAQTMVGPPNVMQRRVCSRRAFPVHPQFGLAPHRTQVLMCSTVPRPTSFKAKALSSDSSKSSSLETSSAGTSGSNGTSPVAGTEAGSNGRTESSSNGTQDAVLSTPSTSGSSRDGSPSPGSSSSLSPTSVATSSSNSSPSTSSSGSSRSSVSSGDKGKGMLEKESGWRRRWTIVLLCFFAFMLCNMDRVNMSVAILPMKAEFGWDSATMGFVQSSFFWGYLLTQVAGGIWADRFGGKLVLGLGVLWWSAATALTPWAASQGLPTLLAARALMGIGEGVAMPAMNTLLSKWVPVKERSRSLALVYSGMFLGSILGLSTSPQMIVSMGWPSLFHIFGSLGIIWFFAWQLKSSSSPEEDNKVSGEEREYVMANTVSSATSEAQPAAAGGGHFAEPVGNATQIPWKLLLSRKEVWAIIVCHFCHNFGTFILLTWMPSYYNQVLHLDLTKSSLLSVLPWMTMALCANLGGWLADSLVDRGASVTAVRKGMQTVGFLGPAFFLSQLSGVSSVYAAVGCMMGAQGLDAFSQSGLYSNHQDIGPRYAGVLLGLSNTAGVLAGVVGSLATGYILQNGTWSQVWQMAIALYLVGTVVWNTFSTGERVFD
uniref:Major facilitator superfamily (MFS) profile domain-containing protein n=1 Tax=Dunaliella tertiolecta TaxID=3047 RepID=A0A7S3VMN6_DUNTE|mmetsp:Transcript_18450/g.51758  ORF Transcript_18450/g.51758 Transcript_18450/m.51758 type:complete len:616 (-) Transcript_18450:1029-2876(-)